MTSSHLFLFYWQTLKGDIVENTSMSFKDVSTYKKLLDKIMIDINDLTSLPWLSHATIVSKFMRLNTFFQYLFLFSSILFLQIALHVSFFLDIDPFNALFHIIISHSQNIPTNLECQCQQTQLLFP